ncbi:hypothetical protein Lal_00023830 [Lupinus albus]|nr:hypothetical protein Lal_00023830 [Lupinus albus]
MALLPTKQFLVLAFLLLCFIFTTGRSLRENSDDNGVEKGQSSIYVLIQNNHEGKHSSSNEVDTMDYTPAKKNPPIHN